MYKKKNLKTQTKQQFIECIGSKNKELYRSHFLYSREQDRLS